MERNSGPVERDLDRETVRWLYRAGQLDADTATLWLLLLSAQERAGHGTAPRPDQLATRPRALTVVDRCLLRRGRTEQAALAWRRAAEALETFARPVARERAVVAARSRLRDFQTVEALVEDYLRTHQVPIGEAHELQQEIAAVAARPDAPPERLVQAAACWQRFGELVGLSVQQGNRQYS